MWVPGVWQFTFFSSHGAFESRCVSSLASSPHQSVCLSQAGSFVNRSSGPYPLLLKVLWNLTQLIKTPSSSLPAPTAKQTASSLFWGGALSLPPSSWAQGVPSAGSPLPFSPLAGLWVLRELCPSRYMLLHSVRALVTRCCMGSLGSVSPDGAFREDRN